MPSDDRRPKAARVTEDCFAALIRKFMSPANPKWAAYSESTKDMWTRELLLMSKPDALGAYSVQEMKPSLIQLYLDALQDRPGKQAVARSVIVQLEKFAIVRDLLPRPITTGIQTGRPQGGHTPWSDHHVELAERHARPDLARVITLAANTGQRRSDLIRMTPNDVEVFQGLEGIKIIQKKTRREVWVPITSALRAAMATWERRPGPYLTRPDGRPWTGKMLCAAWTYHRDNEPALAPLKEAGLVLHGLRGTACVRLRRAGATIPQIADTVGMSVEMVERYCRFSAQRENAAAAVFHLERTLREHTIDITKKNRS